MAEQREILLTLTPEQHRELAENVTELRRRFGAPNATQAILEAVRRARLAEGIRK
jgi:hypothetical protein